jgi:CSLREA domain-containing protein
MRTRRLLLSLLFSLGVTLLTAVALTTKPLPIAHAADLTVDTTLDNESNGCDTDNCTLREAITGHVPKKLHQ